jgi:hypothetical protein
MLILLVQRLLGGGAFAVGLHRRLGHPMEAGPDDSQLTSLCQYFARPRRAALSEGAPDPRRMGRRDLGTYSVPAG